MKKLLDQFCDTEYGLRWWAWKEGTAHNTPVAEFEFIDPVRELKPALK